MKLLLLLVISVAVASARELKNEGRNCWRRCGRKQGPCSWCGTEGVCCRKGWWDKSNGCDGNIGGNRKHACSAPVKNDDEFTEDGEKLDLDECSDVWSARRCNRLKKKNRCDRSRVKQNCAKSCGLCKDKEDEENSTNDGKQPTVVFPEPNEPLEDTSDIKSEADCTPKKSVGTCGRCLSGDQCIEGFCCPYMKVCVKSSSTSCGEAAQCIPVCRDNMEQSECKCQVKDFPDKWAKPSCEDESAAAEAETCDPPSQSSEWCDPSIYGVDHSMCIYPDCPQPSCGEVILRGITDQAVKDSIVKKHNEHRSKIAKGLESKGVDGPQPTASDMRELVWNDELAEVAQRWADQCKKKHDSNRRSKDLSWVGQNVATLFGHFGTDSELCDRMIDLWYNEVNDISAKAVQSYSSNMAETGSTGVIGHYTQEVWSKTNEVGCGFIRFRDDSGWIKTRLVCNYGPGGNSRYKPVYEQGEPGSDCPEGTSATKDGLCASN